MAHCRSSTSASIPEEILGSVREPLTDSHSVCQPTSSSGKTDIRSRTRSTAAAVEQTRPQVAAGKLLFTQYTYGRYRQTSILLMEGDAERKDVQTCAASTRESQ